MYLRTAIFTAIFLSFSLNVFGFVCGSTESTPTNISMNSYKIRPKGVFDEPVELGCSYLNGKLIFEFAVPQGTAKLTITNITTGKQFKSTFSTYYLYQIAFDEQMGIYQIDVETSKGNKYLGILYLD